MYGALGDLSCGGDQVIELPPSGNHPEPLYLKDKTRAMGARVSVFGRILKIQAAATKRAAGPAMTAPGTATEPIWTSVELIVS